MLQPLLALKLQFTICSQPTSYSLRNKMSVLRKVSGFSSESYPPVFLAPWLASTRLPLFQQSSFSTTAFVRARKRDGNTHRGESALRRTGIRYPNGMSKQPLPKPVLDPGKRTKIQVDPNHGLWGFFNKNKKSLSTAKEDGERGMLQPSSVYQPTDWCRSPLDC